MSFVQRLADDASLEDMVFEELLAGPSLADAEFDPRSPWSWIIPKTRYGTPGLRWQWWDDNVWHLDHALRATARKSRQPAVPHRKPNLLANRGIASARRTLRPSSLPR